MMRLLLLAICILAAAPAQAETQHFTDGAPYTLGDKGDDCSDGRIIADPGTKLYTISAKTPASYPAGCRGSITNAAPPPQKNTAAATAFVDFVNCDPAYRGTYLWPGQSLEYALIGGSFVPTGCPARWQLPGGEVDIYIDPKKGTNDWGKADGLAPDRAFAGTNYALAFALHLFQAEPLEETHLVLELCPGCTDEAPIHWPPHGDFLGASGRAAITIDCNGGALGGKYPSYAAFFPAAIVQMRNCNILNGISLNEGAELIPLSGNTVFPVPGGVTFSITGHAILWDDGKSPIGLGTGAGNAFISVSDAEARLPPVNQIGNVIFHQATALVGAGGRLQIDRWNKGHFGVLGQKYQVHCGSLDGIDNLPGSASGSADCRNAE